MDELFTLHPNGLFLRREALNFGYRDRDLVAARRAGLITRVRHGAYAPQTTWFSSDDVMQHRLRGQAVLLTHPGVVALSHTSGAAEHGLRLYGSDLSRIHVTRLDRGVGQHADDIVYHECSWHPDDLWLKDGLLLLGPETCALGTASLTSIEGGVCCLDSVLDLDLGDEDSLWAAYRRRAHWPYSRRLQVTIRLTRRGAQSIAESRTRHLLWTQHLPEPQLQYEVYDARGNLIAITDFAWVEHKLFGEFDGKIKYQKLLKPGEDASEVVVREKAREDAVREATGFEMIRYVYSDLYKPRLTAARTRSKLFRNAA